MRCFLLRNFLQTNMQWRFSDLSCVRFSHVAGVDDVGIEGILVASI